MASMRWARALTPLTLGLLIFQAVLVVTGGAVRLTGSGLGCPTWPECTPGSYRPIKNQAEGTLHSWIEFANRLLTFVLVAFALATLITVLRAGRKDLRLLAAGQFLGIFGQGVLGDDDEIATVEVRIFAVFGIDETLAEDHVSRHEATGIRPAENEGVARQVLEHVVAVVPAEPVITLAAKRSILDRSPERQ